MSSFYSNTHTQKYIHIHICTHTHIHSVYVYMRQKRYAVSDSYTNITQFIPINPHPLPPLSTDAYFPSVPDRHVPFSLRFRRFCQPSFRVSVKRPERRKFGETLSTFKFDGQLSGRREKQKQCALHELSSIIDYRSEPFLRGRFCYKQVYPNNSKINIVYEYQFRDTI